MNRVEAIIFHEQAADELQAKSDEHRWHAARLIAEELDAGKTKAQLGREIGKTEAHVRYMARAWQAKLKFGSGELPPFNQVYNSPEVRGITAAPTVNFRLMPRLRWHREGSQLSLDLTEYRAAVPELVSIYPEDLQPAITGLYERAIEGLYEVVGSLGGYVLDLDKFAHVADEKIQTVVTHAEKLLRMLESGISETSNLLSLVEA